jgi:hypothetical protein
MGFPFRLISTPPALPTNNRTFSAASTILVSCGSRELLKTFFPSDDIEIQVLSSALSPTRTRAASTGAGAGAASGTAAIAACAAGAGNVEAGEMAAGKGSGAAACVVDRTDAVSFFAARGACHQL